jgi:Protein of unknown function (DUF4127)
MTDKYKYRPKIKAIYSDEKIADQFMPYEDRPLRKTVSFHIKAVGATEVTDESQADILFYVFVSRFESGKAESFASEIKNKIDITNDGAIFQKPKWKPFIIADVDIKGEIQGADTKFTESLRSKLLLRDALGYASWNTAGNTIGTALPHGVLSSISELIFEEDVKTKYKPPKIPKDKSKAVLGVWTSKRKERMKLAQTWFMLNRLLDDYVYHSVVRPQAIKFGQSRGWNVFRFDAEQTKVVEEFSSPKVQYEIWKNLNSLSVNCERTKTFNFTLPWGRTFEAEIDFQLDCK